MTSGAAAATNGHGQRAGSMTAGDLDIVLRRNHCRIATAGPQRWALGRTEADAPLTAHRARLGNRRGLLIPRTRQSTRFTANATVSSDIKLIGQLYRCSYNISGIMTSRLNSQQGHGKDPKP